MNLHFWKDFAIALAWTIPVACGPVVVVAAALELAGGDTDGWWQGGLAITLAAAAGIALFHAIDNRWRP